jgi:protein-S-isoprenylcysteine O-methyltransferase Ste14
MSHSTLIFIGCCWLAWLLYWVVMAFRTKRTVERGGLFGYRAVTVAVVFGLLAVARLLGVATHARLWPTPLALGITTDGIVVAGVAFTVWARIALGRNWSAEVTFKQDHELVETGPYALVRNPIYTGLLLMALGTAINYGQVFGFDLFAGLCGGLWWKIRQEEAIMTKHFPDAYADYKQRVAAIVPFVL